MSDLSKDTICDIIVRLSNEIKQLNKDVLELKNETYKVKFNNYEINQLNNKILELKEEIYKLRFNNYVN